MRIETQRRSAELKGPGDDTRRLVKIRAERAKAWP
nr:MAG TPA: hypothetical protein [Caudoviricetes sp.]